MIKSENASDTWKRNRNSISAQPVARLTRLERRGRKTFSKSPPFAYVFWKNSKTKLSKGGGGVSAFLPLDLTGEAPPPLNAPLRTTHGIKDISPKQNVAHGRWMNRRNDTKS